MTAQPAPAPRPLGNVHPGLTKAEVMALKQLGAGKASDGQQKLALEVIVKKFAGYYELTFDENSDRLTNFGEGRRFVGACIQHALMTEALIEPKTKEAD